MIKTLIDSLAIAWAPEIDAITRALDLAAPMLLIGLIVWLCAKAGQWLIDRYTVPREEPMRTADAQRARRDVEELLWRGAQGFENTYPVDEQQQAPRRPRQRAGPPVIVPFPQADAQARRPVQRRPSP